MLSETLRVKLSSEEAGYAALTPVVVSEMTLVELLEQIVAVVGLDAPRVGEVLKRGSLVSGATRFRWTGLAGTPEEIGEALRRLPGPEPGRRLETACCTEIVLLGHAERIQVSTQLGQRRRLFSRCSFWDELMTLAGTAVYAGYQYQARADRYTAELKDKAWLAAAARRLRHDGLRRRIAAARLERVEFIVPRGRDGS